MMFTFSGKITYIIGPELVSADTRTGKKIFYLYKIKFGEEVFKALFDVTPLHVLPFSVNTVVKFHHDAECIIDLKTFEILGDVHRIPSHREIICSISEQIQAVITKIKNNLTSLTACASTIERLSAQLNDLTRSSGVV